MGNMANRYKHMDAEPWNSRGVHRMNAKSFAVFYMVLEDYHEVYILSVIYQKRDLFASSVIIPRIYILIRKEINLIL